MRKINIGSHLIKPLICLKNEIIKRGTIPTKIILYDEYRKEVATTIYRQKYLEGKFILLTGYSTEDNNKKAENTEKLGNSLKSNEWRIR